MKSRRLAIANLAVCVGLLAAGLWPFQFFPENNVKWLPEDRKSTRLNSSHLVISYAVFCLKKKKNQNNEKNALNKATGQVGYKSTRTKQAQNPICDSNDKAQRHSDMRQPADDHAARNRETP